MYVTGSLARSFLGATEITLKKYCAALLRVGMPVKMLRLRRSETLSISSLTSWKGSAGPKLCRPPKHMASAVLETRVWNGIGRHQTWDLCRGSLAKVVAKVDALVYMNDRGGIGHKKQCNLSVVRSLFAFEKTRYWVSGMGTGEGGLTGRANACAAWPPENDCEEGLLRSAALDLCSQALISCCGWADAVTTPSSACTEAGWPGMTSSSQSDTQKPVLASVDTHRKCA